MKFFFLVIPVVFLGCSSNENSVCNLDYTVDRLIEDQSDEFPSKVYLSGALRLTERDSLLLRRLEKRLGFTTVIMDYTLVVDQLDDLSIQTPEPELLDSLYFRGETSKYLFKGPDRIYIAPYSEIIARTDYGYDAAFLGYNVENSKYVSRIDVSYKSFFDRFDTGGSVMDSPGGAYTVFYSQSLKKILQGQCYFSNSQPDLEKCFVALIGYPVTQFEGDSVNLGTKKLEKCNFFERDE